ncbi:MAG: two-component system sensor kinase [Acidimicrobiaceae bacterium]|nr:MAG: two-component system sensor kinase [Acidimicrobiaceae bacterium]
MRRRLVLAFVAMTVVVLAAHDVPLAAYLRRVETERLLSGIERDAFIVGGTSEDVLSGEDIGEVADLQTTIELYRSREDAGVVVTDAAGIAIAVADGSSEVGENYINRPEIQAALGGAPASGSRYSNTLAASIVYVAVPVLSGADIVGVVRITYPAAIIDERTSERVRGLYAVGLISLAGAIVAAVFVASTLTRPLRRLQDTTEQLSGGDLTARADSGSGPPEIRNLAESFNEMTERIQALIEQQRSFAGDASHQLRTPLTALRLQLEQGVDLIDTDPAAARARIEAAGAETERLQQLVSGLLLLARSEHAALQTEVVDVAAIVRDRVDLWCALASDRDITVQQAGGHRSPGLVHVLAVPGAVEQVLDNLIDNAIKVSPDGTTIELALDRRPPWLTVHVLDEGPGMTTEQLEYARNRFWRSPDAPHQGSGLGLAIVEHLATASGGTVSLANRATGGLDAAVNWRLAAPR